MTPKPPGWQAHYTPPQVPPDGDAALRRERDALRAALLEIYAHAHCAVRQRAPSDDAIIAEHIEAVRDIARAALAANPPAGGVREEG